MRIKLIAIGLLLMCTAVGAHAQKPTLCAIDRVRLAEAFRLGDAVGNRIWKEWDKAPFAVLLVTPENEFLIRHPKPSGDFTLIGNDSLLKSDVYFRKKTYAANLLATFPAVGGVSTIVVGQAEKTDAKTSTPWVVTLLHEHFHQLQDSQPRFYEQVSALDLARGDTTGMWMLNYPFPYDSYEVKQQIFVMSRLLADALKSQSKDEFSANLDAYLTARKQLKQMLTAGDYKYFSFQLWKEGTARYTEYQVARLAAESYKPTKDFTALSDYSPFKIVADQLMNRIISELSTLELEKSKRVSFYPLGAGEALSLDRVNPRWRERYFEEKFFLERYFN